MKSRKIRKHILFYTIALLLATTSCSKSGQLKQVAIDNTQKEEVGHESDIEGEKADESANQKTKIDNLKSYFINLKFVIISLLKKTLTFFMLLLIGGLFMYLFLYYKIKQILFDDWMKYKQELKQNKNNRFLPLLIYKYIELLKERKDFHKEGSSTKEESSTKENLLRIKQDNKKVNIVAEAKDYSKDKLKKKKSEEKKTTELFVSYFQIPDKDGFFDLDYSEDSLCEKCFYIVESMDMINGKLLFNSEAIAVSAFNNIDDYLKPACEIENESSLLSAKKIEMVQTGSVKLSNNKWVVNDKIKIKFM